MTAAERQFADAFPRKRFFVEMFTRDIALEDCILDLIDNSIDSLIRSRDIDLEDDIASARRVTKPKTIEVNIGPKAISITDDCGGIEINKARHEVFNFGHSVSGANDLTDRGLGAYGIGLKRAIFKIGRHFQVDSSHANSSFRVEQDLRTWVNRDSEISEWRFPLKELALSSLKCPKNGTHIEVSDLYENIRDLAKNEAFFDGVVRSIARTYSFFLSKYVRLTVNDELVDEVPIPIGTSSSEYKAATDTYNDDGVKVRLRAGLAPRGPRGEWQMDRAGWYVLCNGRTVVSADKTALTGWGAGILPQFHSSKGRGFVGTAMFTSDDPQKLPWTTTKRGLNRESPVYLRARNRMQSVARPVYSYLESLYPTGDESTLAERDATKEVMQGPTAQLFEKGTSSFSPPRSRTPSNTVNIQYRALKKELEAIRDHLDSAGMSAAEIGKHTFDYFMDNEELR